MVGCGIEHASCSAWRRFPRSVARLILAAAFSALHAAQASAADHNLDRLRQRALELVNEARQAHGRARLELGPDLDQAAQAHAEDMFKRHYYSHTSPQGDTVQDRYEAAGGSRWKLVAENIARCQGCNPPATGQTVADLQDGWMHSPHHRENILRQGLSHFGFGIVVDATQGLYAVQTFAGPGTPRGTSDDEAAPATLAPEEIASRAAQLLNRARDKAGVADLQVSPALTQAARSLFPAPNSGAFSLKQDGNLMHALPAGQRGKWRSLAVIAGACGGCGTQPTAADLRFFRRQWLDDPRYRDRLLNADFTELGFGLQTNGEGRKVAVLVLGNGR